MKISSNNNYLILKEDGKVINKKSNEQVKKERITNRKIKPPKDTTIRNKEKGKKKNTHIGDIK